MCSDQFGIAFIPNVFSSAEQGITTTSQGLELVTLMPLPPQFRDYKSVPPPPQAIKIFLPFTGFQDLPYREGIPEHTPLSKL